MSNLIYHYTSVEAFKSIVENKQLWLTNVQFLNDSEELKDGVKVFDQLYQFTKDEISLKNANLFAEELNRQVQSVINLSNIFVISFSTSGDRKSQWESYAKEGGISIGIDRNFIPVEIRKFTFGDCIYKKSQKEDKLRKLISEDIVNKYIAMADKKSIKWNKVWLDAFESVKESIKVELPSLSESEDFNEQLEKIFLISYSQMTILRMISRFKNENFYEEKECRYIKILLKKKFEDIFFRVKDNCLIPYVKTPFDINSISEIILSPQLKEERYFKAIKMFLQKSNLANVNVKASTIPML